MSPLPLQLDQFIRSFTISQNEIFSVFLGAGASINSGIPSAYDCIWHWKQSIFQTKTGFSFNGMDYKSDHVKQHIQRWLDQEGTYPPLDSPDEYSFYIDQCYPVPGDSSKFFRSTFEGKQPSIGYKLLMQLHEMERVHTIWTTNFDDLCSKAATLAGRTPIDTTLDSPERILRPYNKGDLPIIKLHGDYKFGPLKNTETELRTQDETFRRTLVNYLADKHLIVLGYSGRDSSIMECLAEAYSTSGAGRLFWCGYGHAINPQVEKLLLHARANGRTAYFIPTDGFDKTLISLTTASCQGNKQSETKLDRLLEAEKEQEPCSPFRMEVPFLNIPLKSNLFPIEFPKEVFQFDYNYQGQESPWKEVRGIIWSKDIAAVPKGKGVWALGTLSEIHAAFGQRLLGSITRVPILDQTPWKDSALHHLLLFSVTKSLAQRAGLPTEGKNCIWLRDVSTQRMIGGSIFFAHTAVRLGFTTDGSRNYLSFMPDFVVKSEHPDVKVTKEIKQEIGRFYFEKIYNKQFSDYINEWRSMLLDLSNPIFIAEYPFSSGSGFSFSISRSPGFAQIMRAGSTSGQTVTISEHLLLFKGIQYQEPELIFAPRTLGMKQAPTDFHPMRGISKNRPYDHPLVGTFHESTIRLGVICPTVEGPQFATFLNRVQARVDGNQINKDYLIDYPGFYEAYGVSLTIPQVGTSLWAICEEPNVQLPSLRESALDLKNKIIRQIDLLMNDGVKKVLVICIPDRWLDLTAFDEENEHFDLHNYIKAYCAERGISTQFIQQETLRDSLHCQISWWLSLSYFVKSLRTPWVLNGLDKDTAFAGIGYSVTKRKEQTEIILGCSHIYNAQGQGLKYRLAKIEDQLVWDGMDNPHMSYNDAYRFGLSIVELFHATMNELPKRVVVHKRNSFTDDEVKGIYDSLKSHQITSLDLIEINYEDNIRFLAGTIQPDGSPKIEGFPVNRGTCILLNEREALLWTHGVAKSVRNDNYKYFLGGRYIPAPIRIIKHYGNGNIGQIANEILGLTKVNWNSFDLYSPLPATVSSSNEIAKIGKLLSKREGGNYDYRYFI